MDINEILSIEVQALSQTICEYTTDNFISSYAKQLTSVQYPEESDKLRMLVARLLEWYGKEMDNILHDKFISAKEAHTKSYKLLKDLAGQL